MVLGGQVVGGDYMNSAIDTNRRGELIVELVAMGDVVFKSRRIDDHEVVEWEEVLQERGEASGLVGSVGQAVAGAALPGVLGKAASAAVGAGLDALKRQRVVRVEWNDGRRSLLRLPHKLFVHFELLLEDRRVTPAVSATRALVVQPEAMDPTGQVLAQVAGFIQDRRSAYTPPDVLDQIEELAGLRNRGILTEEEFVAKKAELLGRI